MRKIILAVAAICGATICGAAALKTPTDAECEDAIRYFIGDKAVEKAAAASSFPRNQAGGKLF